MNKGLLWLKFFILLPFLLVIVSAANAQTRTATVSGNWNSATTWGGAAPPTSANAVIINDGVNVTVDVASAACASLTMANGIVSNTLTISGTNSLSVTGAVTMGIGTEDDITRTVSVGAGSLSCASLAMGNPSSSDGGSACILTLSTGTVSVTGNIDLAGNTNENFITFTGAGKLNVGGVLDNSGNLTAGSGTVNYNGSSAQVVEDVYVYNNLQIGGGGGKTLGGNTQMTGDFTLDAGTTLALGSRDLTINVAGNRTATINGTLHMSSGGILTKLQTGTKTLVLNSGAFLRLTSSGSALPGFDAYIIDPNSTIEWGSGGSQNIKNGTVSPTFSYGNLVISGSGTKSLETTGGTMTINGSVTISSSTTLNNNNKTVNLTGNLTNNGTFTPGTAGGLVLNGTTLQTIGGSSVTNLRTLEINNAAGASLDQDVNVSTSLTLTSGVITTSATNILTLADNATTSGGTSTSFVNGPLAKVGDDAFVFPVGKAGQGLRTIAISAPAASNTFTAEFLKANPQSLGTTLSSGITQISACEYWTLGRAINASNVSVTLSWANNSQCNGASYVTTPLTLLVARLNGSTWANEGRSSSSGSSAAGTVTSAAAVASFTTFALGSSVSTDNPLPVMFADVKAFAKNNGVQLEWSNLTEKDIAYYSIERSADGRTFVPVAQQLPARNQNDKESYSSFDGSPFQGSNYYRIRAVEVTGKVVFSKSLRVDIGIATSAITLYPNPVNNNQFAITLNNKAGQYTLRVLNSAGQQVYSKQIIHQGGSITQTVELPAAVKPGVYNLVISSENLRESKMFLVQ
jgi:hypothetical protein